ncbi:mitogen-activated protein kinase MPS1 [Phycomyces blakesleeanus]|uniref:Mitogen-activated protein kinase n=1 Tax=Phycomyces blakesleeanus (strain ATCC 8743b / DSM 1359 / FGSC 10004 / NBRC 33097 / NRRL 1555) TaxID=763407 RepID=A0A167QZW6_PHYB8|nr:mitogen-activated protein kinase MPS1 [Phycomyces blakesleeanus NRRL 1555(-)]OAD80530.1 mitogen-activated protein kinase MPS1 [Phycomyces blakesleeanus NRRL 1555(-)]|eukprot:XP_018298570.1 mitogen-activated protein kinase MPS1 [Phycomyces blakesleeanus NRRL 1555(-)]
MVISDQYYSVAIEGGQETFTIDKKYRIIRKVGSGSYGTVCSAIHVETNEVVAIKKCLRIFDRKLVTKRCLREIKLLQHLNGHPRIIGLRALDIVDYSNFNEIYLLQECCDTTMADVIHSKLGLEPVHYQWFIYQILSALKYIHSAHVLHRDLKPANILVNQNCDIRICDFGMARGIVQPSSLHETPSMTHYVVTRWYRAPEIMMSRNSYDKAIDMWSVGCIFAELLGRKVLFKGNDYVDQLHKIVGILGLPEDTSFWDQNASKSVVDYIKNLRDVNGEPPPTEPIDFAAHFPECPPEGIDLLQRLLHLDPKRRINANEALEHPYVALVRDPPEEVECNLMFDFESFERIQDEDTLRQCIIDAVKSTKPENTPSNRTESRTNSLQPPSEPHFQPQRRYTGSSISTPTTASATEAHLNAIAAVQQGKDFPIQESDNCAEGMLVGSNQFVGEPEDMDEDDIKLMDSDDSLRVDSCRHLVGPYGADVQAIERQLSYDW